MRAADLEIVVTGIWLRVAAVNAEDYETRNRAEDPEKLLAELQQQGIRADIFTFAQRVPDVTPRFQDPLRWDNVAAFPMLGYGFRPSAAKVKVELAFASGRVPGFTNWCVLSWNEVDQHHSN